MAHIASNGKCLTPKYVGLSISIHQMTQSKEAVQLISKHGHGISYGEVGKIDQNWVEAQSTASVPVPTNIVPGRITHAAGDNFIRGRESLRGQHFDVLNIVL